MQNSFTFTHNEQRQINRWPEHPLPPNKVILLGGSNEIDIFGRIVAFLVSYASEFQGVSFDTPHDLLV